MSTERYTRRRLILGRAADAELPILLESALKGQDLFELAKTCGAQVEPSSQT